MSYATVPLVSCTWSARPSPTSHSTSTASPASSSARVGTSATRATPCSGRERDDTEGTAASGHPDRGRRSCGRRRTSRRQCAWTWSPWSCRLPSAWTCGAIGPGSAGTRSPLRCRATMARTQSSSCVDRVGVVPGERDDRPVVAGREGVRAHQVDVDPDVGSEVGLVDDQQVGTLDARSALAGHVTTAGDVDHEHLDVDEGRRERRGEVVPTRLHQHQVQRPVLGDEVLDGQQVGGDVVADGGVRTCSGLDRDDPRGVQHARGPDHPGVLVGVDVVGDDPDLQLVAEVGAEQHDERGLAGADGAADAQPELAGTLRHGTTSWW